MTTVNFSIEELIFCLYNEGCYQNGVSLKEAYFPNLNDEELNLVFQVACRSLLAKDMVELRENQYRLKEEFKPYIHVLNFSPHHLKASKILEDGEQETINFYFKNDVMYIHSFLHNQQVFRLTKTEDLYAVPNLEAFFNMPALPEQMGEELFICTGDQFEILLAGIIENNNTRVEEFLAAVGRSGKVLTFIEDLKRKKGKFNSIMDFKTEEGKAPEIQDITFLLPAESRMWFITGSARNRFVLKEGSQEELKLLSQIRIASIGRD